VLAPEGSFFLNISGSNSRPWLPFELIVRLRRLFVLQNHITWIKSIATGDDSVGHFKPLAGARFLNHNHEHIFHLTLGGAVKLDRLAVGVPFKDKSNIARRGHKRSICPAGASGCTARRVRAFWTRLWARGRRLWRRNWKALPPLGSTWTKVIWVWPPQGLRN
jgi:hypothetical protein